MRLVLQLSAYSGSRPHALTDLLQPYQTSKKQTVLSGCRAKQHPDEATWVKSLKD